MFFRPEFYDAAFASSGCHDNRMDKIWWNEQWMGEMGPHYEANSNVTAATNLKGAIFLAVGELDTNVDPASTTQVPGNGLEFSDGPPPPSEDFFVRPFAGDRITGGGSW